MYHDKLEKQILSPIDYYIDLFSGKWKIRILCVLALNQTIRYNDLKRKLVYITDAVLSTTLREMISCGLICRTKYNELPLKVEYSLTSKGKSVLPIMRSMCKWSQGFWNKECNELLPCCKNCNQLL